MFAVLDTGYFFTKKIELKQSCHQCYATFGGLQEISFETNKKVKSNFHYTCGITPTHLTSGGANRRRLAHGQHSFEDMWQRWRAISDTAFDLTDPGIKPRSPASSAISLTTTAIGRLSRNKNMEFGTNWYITNKIFLTTNLTNRKYKPFLKLLPTT